MPNFTFKKNDGSKVCIEIPRAKRKKARLAKNRALLVYGSNELIHRTIH